MGLIESANIGVTNSRQRRGWPCGHDISASIGFRKHVHRPRMGFEVEWNITPSMVEAVAVTARLTVSVRSELFTLYPQKAGGSYFKTMQALFWSQSRFGIAIILNTNNVCSLTISPSHLAIKFWLPSAFRCMFRDHNLWTGFWPCVCKTLQVWIIFSPTSIIVKNVKRSRNLPTSS